jgi:tetratricopeptide (TPR) repeat protein
MPMQGFASAHAPIAAEPSQLQPLPVPLNTAADGAAIQTDWVSADDIHAHRGASAAPRPQPLGAEFAESPTSYMLAPRRGGVLMPLTLTIGIIIAGALAWFFATGEVPFRSLLASNPAAHAPEPPAPQAQLPPPGQAAVPAPVIAQPQPKPDVPKPEATKPEIARPRVDYTEFPGFSGVGKDLATTSPLTADACRDACSDNQQCRAFTHAGESCTLLSEIGGLQPDPDHRLAVRSDQPQARRLRQLVEAADRAKATFRPIEGVTLAGGTATAKLSVSRDQCQFNCGSDATCKAYSFATLVGACRLYAQVVPRDAKAAVGVVTVVNDPDGQITADVKKAVLAKQRPFKAYPGLELNGPNVRHLPLPDAGACRQACVDDNACIAASFADGDCLRFTGVETIRSRPGVDGFLDASDPKLVERVDDAVKREAKGETELLPGFDLLGTALVSDKARLASTPEECQASCKEAQSCTGYSFLHAERKCTIETAVTDAVPDPGRTAGLFRGPAAATIEAIKRRIQQSEASRAQFRDMPATCSPQGAGSVAQLGTQAVPEQCAYLCRASGNCQGWAFNRNDHTCNLMTSVTGAQAGGGLNSGVLDPTGKRVAELVRSCGPVPPGGLIGTPANECDRQAGLAGDAELPKGIDPRPNEFIDPARAIPACLKALDGQPNVLRWRVSLGRAFERAGRFEDARQAYLQAANDGSGPGAFLYGVMANKGQGGPQDDADAERYFKIARARGFGPASAALGLLYTYGDRPQQPGDADALRLLEEAAARGQASALYRLGEAYERGRLNRRILPIDAALAQDYYVRARQAFLHDAEANDVAAYRYLSLIYDGGRGVPKDIEQSLSYLVTYLTALYGPDNLQARERGTVGDLHLDDWSVETRRAFQQYLRDRGAFTDAANGVISTTTIDAVDKWLGLRG